MSTTANPSGQAILIEDEAGLRLATAQTLELGGFVVQACASAEQGLTLLRADFAGVIVTDVRLPGRSGLALLADAVALDPDLPVIVVTGHGDVEMAVEAMRAGAYDFIEKPFAAERLLGAVRRAQEKRWLVLENRRLTAAWEAHPEMPLLVGTSAAIEQVRTLIRTLGPTTVDVLINGDTGTGKEVVARQLHAASARRGAFVAINCGALPESVFESEMFGHEAGAFTGAHKRRIGKLEYAAGGTVFLDEIESMPLALQVKLLRVLQERRLERLGGNDSIAIDCRIIAASKIDLLQASAAGSFREDLYYRISVVAISLPRLRARRSDIPLLLAHFVQRAALRHGRPAPLPQPQQLANWQARDWPGNVRELRNFAERLVLGVADQNDQADVSHTIRAIDVDGNDICAGSGTATASAAGPGAGALGQRVDAYERELIVEAMAAREGNVAAAAEQLQVPKKTLYDKLRKFRLSPGRQGE
jgi:two-component system C4-dicarboxylate transport response regulator DctD